MESSIENKKSLAFELFFVSFTSLFFELIVIRWLSCDFVCFSVFKTFPLVTCFVGLGVGVSKASDKLFRHAGPTLFLFALVTYVMGVAGIGAIPFPAAGLYQWSDPSSDALLWFNIFRMILAIVLLLAGPFAVMVCIGSRIGVLFNKLSPLSAYCIDIAGAIAGSLLFAFSSFAGLSPAGQVCVTALLLALFTFKHARPFWPAAIALAASASFAFILPASDVRTYWSPYTRIDVNELQVPKQFIANSEPESAGNLTEPLIDDSEAEPEESVDKGSNIGNNTEILAKYKNEKSNSQLLGILLKCNHGFQQIFTRKNHLELNAEGKKQSALLPISQLLDVRNNYYSLPYKIARPKRVLVLGAGTGSDVREALRHGAKSVDAVEIDPRIVEIGKQYNPNYHSDKVQLIVDDARNFVNKSSAKRYDMIVIACLDSLAFSGSGSSMRTDSYIHSRDCYKRCLAMLNPGGLFVVSFGAPVSGHNDWLRDKMYRTLEAAAGYPPIVETDLDAPFKWPAYVFISGIPVRDKLVEAPRVADSFQPVSVPPDVQARMLTDDWPYLYIRPLGLDLSYLTVVLVVIAITTYAARRLIFAQNSPSDGQMFGLGAAFMLLELQAISRLSLLYGTTWVTTSVVINGVLFMILAANFIVVKFGSALKQKLLYALLTASLAASYFLPVNKMLAWDESGAYSGHLSITVITLLPVFAAGLLFAAAFSKVKNAARSFAFNLLGSVAGALLEYLSTYWGIKSLLIVAFACYFASFMFHCKDSTKTEV